MSKRRNTKEELAVPNEHDETKAEEKLNRKLIAEKQKAMLTERPATFDEVTRDVQMISGEMGIEELNRIAASVDEHINAHETDETFVLENPNRRITQKEISYGRTIAQLHQYHVNPARRARRKAAALLAESFRDNRPAKEIEQARKFLRYTKSKIGKQFINSNYNAHRNQD